MGVGMSKKVFEIAFKITGDIGKSFKNGFNSANKTLTDMNKRTADLKKNMEGLQSLAQKGLAIGGAGLAGAGFLAKEAMNAESAFADFKKVFNGAEEDLAKFNKEFMRLSSETGKSYEDVTLMGSAAAQAGIKDSEIVQFTENAIQMGVAFDMAAEEAGQSLAELRVQFKLSQDEVVLFGDKLNYLGNTTPNTSKKLLEVTQRVGSLGKLANLTESDIAALAASVVGMEPDVMATGIKGVIYALSAGEGATKSQREAYAELGLTAEKVNKSMQKDSKKTMLTVLEAVKKLPKEKQANILTSLFGKEGVGVTSQMVDNLDDVKKNINAISDANKDAWQGAMLKEYQARMETTELAMSRAKQAWRNIGITIGSIFLPYIAQASEKISEVASRVSEWMEKNPELTASLTKWGVVFAAVVAGVSGLSIALITLVGPIVMVGKFIGGFIGIFVKILSVVKYIKYVGTAIMWLGRIFLMNPIGLVITAIIAAIYLLWTNWDTVSKWIAGAWDYIKEKGSALLTWFSSLPSKFVEFGRNLLQGLADGIKNGVSSAVKAAGEAVEAVKNKVKNFFGINSPSKLFAQYGEWNMEGLAIGMQSGAPMAERASGQAISGVMPTGRSLTSSQGVSSQSTYSITLNLNGNSSGLEERAKQGTIDAIKQLEKAKRREQRVSFA